MNNTHSTAIERTCRRCGITIVGTSYACPGETGELCSFHCLESAYESRGLEAVVTNNRKYLAEVLQRADLATPGPWKNDGGDLWHVGVDYNDTSDPHTYLGISRSAKLLNSKQIPLDLDFIVHARRDVPVLLAQIATLDAEVNRLRTALNEIANSGVSSDDAEACNHPDDAREALGAHWEPLTDGRP